MSINPILTSPYAVAAFIFFASVVCGLVLIRKQYLRLNHIRGPLWARWTNLGLIWQFRVKKRNFRDIALELEGTYGPVVRYGPNRVLFSDPSATQIIYGTSKVFEKV
jgi:hypothetical protein